jgi:FixJ family two-component response regulator
MAKHDITHMSQPEQESDDREEFRERIDRIIEREHDILDRLAD